MSPLRRWFGQLRLGSTTGQVADDFTDPLMVEDHRHAERSYDHGHAVIYRQRVGMVYFMAIPADGYQRERPERCPVLERANRLGETIM